MGCPTYPTPAQVKELKEASELKTEELPVKVEGEEAVLGICSSGIWCGIDKIGIRNKKRWMHEGFEKDEDKDKNMGIVPCLHFNVVCHFHRNSGIQQSEIQSEAYR